MTSALQSPSNEHIECFLQHYFARPFPSEYAVLINGPFGSGKTFFMKRILSTYFTNPKDYLYISLNGLQTTSEIDAAIFASIIPFFHNRYTKLGGKLSQIFLSNVGIKFDLNRSDFKFDLGKKILIFDDLERAMMPSEVLLGYLNNFIEHEGSKVIILANESEISEREKYLRKKEKIVGRSFEIQEASLGIISHLIPSHTTDSAKTFLETHKYTIASLFDESKTRNFRLLKYALDDFVRLFIILEKNNLHTKPGVPKALTPFIAISIEYRAGNISQADLQNRPKQIAFGMIARKNQKSESAIYLADQKYSTVYLSDDIWSDDLLIDMICIGLYNEQKIISHLKDRADFSDSKIEPAWQGVWHGLDRSDKEFDQALARIMHQGWRA